MTDGHEATSASLEATALRRLNAQLADANEELAKGHLQFHAVLNNITQGVCLFDGDGRLLVCNRRYAEIYNLSAAMTRPGLSLAEIVDYRFSVGSAPSMTRGEFLEIRGHVIAGSKPADSTVHLRNGRIVSIHHEPMEGGGWVATHEDITERENAEASIRFMARHDALTSLPNRVLFLERLEQAVVMAMRSTPFALFALDLDHFKSVNDTFGHPVGDGLLKAAAERLQSCVRDGDTVARLGGDEFAIIQLSVERSDEAVLLGDRLMDAFRAPFEISGHHIVAGFSVGITLAPGDGASSDLLLKNADIALYLSKSEGRGRIRFFEPEMDARIQIRRRLEEDLRAAIAGRQFELFYHPLVNLSTGKIVSLEALLRWRHPSRGLVPPTEFISVAEETGMIVSIGEWALNVACAEAMRWPPDVRVAVNLSAVQFARGDLMQTVRKALSVSGLPGDRLELEITETALLRRSPGTLATLHELRGMGVTIALDDFGTGYSSLSYLRSFPFHKIKIDQSFIRDILKHDDSLAIVRAIVSLGQSLRMTIAAEGVETRDQLELLRAAGCSEVQGYLFGEPAPAANITSTFYAAPEMDGLLVRV